MAALSARPRPSCASCCAGRASFWGVPVSALYWCDGKRTLAEVIRLTQLEMGPQNFDFLGYFKFLEKHGYVEFVK